MGGTVRFERRFQGFAEGALGGYAAGVAAQGIEGPAEANLRSLPPMDRDLELTSGDDGSLELRDGDTLVLEVHPSEFEARPDRPGPEEVEAATARPRPRSRSAPVSRLLHLWSRARGGRRPAPVHGVGTGPTGNPRLELDPGPGPHPGAGLPGEFIWAALDCPTIWAVWLTDDGAVSRPEGTFPVLARQRLEQLAPVRTGEQAIVTAWPISHDGRKHTTALRSTHRTGSCSPAPSRC